MAGIENSVLTRGDVLQKGVRHATVYETGHPRWVVRESIAGNTLYDGEEASWDRVYEGRDNPAKFRLTPTEHLALKHHVLVPPGIRRVVRSGADYLQSYYPRKTADLERYLFDYTDPKNPRFDTLSVPLMILENMMEQIAPAVDALTKVRIYHGDILLINTLIDEPTGELSIIDFGRSAVHTGLVTDGEADQYKQMRGGFLHGIRTIVDHSGIGGQFPHLKKGIADIHEGHWEHTYASNNTTCQEYASQIKPFMPLF